MHLNTSKYIHSMYVCMYACSRPAQVKAVWRHFLQYLLFVVASTRLNLKTTIVRQHSLYAHTLRADRRRIVASTSAVEASNCRTRFSSRSAKLHGRRRSFWHLFLHTYIFIYSQLSIAAAASPLLLLVITLLMTTKR